MGFIEFIHTMSDCKPSQELFESPIRVGLTVGIFQVPESPWGACSMALPSYYNSVSEDPTIQPKSTTLERCLTGPWYVVSLLLCVRQVVGVNLLYCSAEIMRGVSGSLSDTHYFLLNM